MMATKLLMIVVDERFRDAVEDTLTAHGADGFTELPMALGQGRSGKKLASRLHPGANSVIFAVLDATRVDEVAQALVKDCRDKAASEGAEDPIRIAVMPVDAFI